MNRLLPAPSDVLWAIMATLHAILVIVALISLTRARAKHGWVATVFFIVFVPLVGPMVRLAATREPQ